MADWCARFPERRAGIGQIFLNDIDEHKLPKLASEYFAQNSYVGVSQPGPDDARAREVLGIEKFMWGSDYPHDEGTYPFTREHLRHLFHDTPANDLQQLLAGNAARVYHFDLDALAPLASTVGPTVSELCQRLITLPDEPNEALLKATGARN